MGLQSRKKSDREMCVPTACASSISSSASTKLNSAIWALSAIIGLCDILTMVLGRFNGEILTTVGTGLVMMLIGFLAAGFGLALLQNKSEKYRPVIEAVTICLTLLVSVASLGVCAIQAYLLNLRTFKMAEEISKSAPAQMVSRRRLPSFGRLNT